MYVGHNCSDRERTPFGVYIFGSCISDLFQIQALGGRRLPPHRWHSELEIPATVAQKCKGAIFKSSELGLRIFFAACSAWARKLCWSLWVGWDFPLVLPPSRGRASDPCRGQSAFCLVFTRRTADVLRSLRALISPCA